MGLRNEKPVTHRQSINTVENRHKMLTVLWRSIMLMVPDFQFVNATFNDSK